MKERKECSVIALELQAEATHHRKEIALENKTKDRSLNDTLRENTKTYQI